MTSAAARFASLVALLFAAAAPTTFAAERAASAPRRSLDDDAARGRRLAQVKCSPCHLIDNVTPDKAKASPNPSAPPFQVIALAYQPVDLEEALAEGIMVGHNAKGDPNMPEFELTARQARALTAYLERLRGR